MDLGELLDELRVGILNDRSNNTGLTSDYLWTDTTLVRYINEAHRRWAAKTFCINDATTDEVTLVTLRDGVTNYTLHDSIVAVRSAKLTSATYDLVRVGHAFLAQYRAPSETWVSPEVFADAQPGPPVAYSTDEEVGEDDDGSRGAVVLRVYPAPDADTDGATVRLRVVRTPLEDFTVTGTSAVPEIPRDHHLEMLDWAAYLALRVVDDDAGNPRRAGDFKATFEQNVTLARNMVLRKMFAPTPWGFGRGGFTWER